MANTIKQALLLDSDALWDKPRTARYLGISRYTLDQWVAKPKPGRDVPFVRVGAHIRFRPEDVREFVSRNRVVAGGNAA